ncbi:MAG TPA: hypothetical protein VLC08_08570 [Chitinolyticbacter sp.]|nr:hypothetical protein [Chitinolyticbacter sp.]
MKKIAVMLLLSLSDMAFAQSYACERFIKKGIEETTKINRHIAKSNQSLDEGKALVGHNADIKTLCEKGVETRMNFVITAIQVHKNIDTWRSGYILCDDSDDDEAKESKETAEALFKSYLDYVRRFDKDLGTECKSAPLAPILESLD